MFPHHVLVLGWLYHVGASVESLVVVRILISREISNYDWWHRVRASVESLVDVRTLPSVWSLCWTSGVNIFRRNLLSD